MTFYINNDTDVVLDEVESANPVDPDNPYINTITDMSAALKDSSGTTIATAAMSYRTGTDGQYVGTFPAASMALVNEAEYVCHITSTQAGIDIRVDGPAKYRGAGNSCAC